MSEAIRPSINSVQKTLGMGILIGLICGILFGISSTALYIRQNPPTYQGGAYPSEMTQAYQKHYMAMVVDSYIVNKEPNVAVERLKTFSSLDQIKALGERSAAYVAAGRGDEAQLINNLALALKGTQGWSDDDIKTAVLDLANQYGTDPARAQGISSFSAMLLNAPLPTPGQPAPAAEPAPVPVPAMAASRWPLYLLCCLLLLVVLIIVYLLGRRQFEKRRKPTQQVIDWVGEGPAPIKAWSGTYTLGQDNYDEFFTIESEDNDFLGECGMGILEVVPGTSPKQVLAFDVGLFDKTDITTLSRAVMSEFAYNDPAVRAKIDANPQAKAILAEPGKEFVFESTALRVAAKIEEVVYAEGGNKYFEKLTLSLNLFIKEGADLRVGEMDIPDKFKS
jgi:uncharacterized protein YneF (UPF0154 family)